MSLFWTILTVGLALIEAATSQLVCIWFAGGAFAALIASICSLNFFWQFIIFIVVSVILLILTRPIVRKIKSKSDTKTNVDALIGQIGVVTETISNLSEQGAVRLSGITWSARSADNTVIEQGAVVRVLKIEGVKLIVESEEV